MADLLSVDTVARYLGLSEPGDQYSTISEMIDAAQAILERYTGRSLGNQTRYTEYHDSATVIYVDKPPISTVYSLTDDYHYGSRSIALTDIIDSVDDGGRNYEVGKIECAPWGTEGGFTGGRLAVAVDYLGGWTTATLPDDLRQAWIDLVVLMFNAPDRLVEGRLLDRDVPGAIRAICWSYRREV